MWPRINVFIFLCFVTIFANAQELRVGVFRDFSIKRITISQDQGEYLIVGDSTELVILSEGVVLDITQVNGKIQLKVGQEIKGEFDKVICHQLNQGSSLNLVPKSPVVKQRKYQDNFEFLSGNKGITIVNLVDIDNYLAGVVESEGGGGGHLEYYKVQALMSRTYAMKYKNRHQKEGFSICDRVHCQAYHSMLRFTPKIRDAVFQTEGIVMTDQTNKLVDSYFHANCGGQTCEPDYIWNNPIPYLNTFLDTFCIYTKQARWEKRVTKSEWSKFLVNEYNYPISDSIFAQQIYTFNQLERKAFYLHPALGIPLRDIREKFGLKSTLFSCYPEGDFVVIKGRGFGHGVGLCQEGAMKMARVGYTYDQIARFYFPGVDLIRLEERSYFNQVSATSD